MADFLVLESAYARGPAGPVTLEAGRVISDLEFDVDSLRSQGAALAEFDAATMADGVAAFRRQRGKPGLEGDLTAILVGLGALPSLFGTQFQFAESIPETTTTGGPVTKLVLTTTDLPAGSYLVFVQGIMRYGASNTRGEINALQDGSIELGLIDVIAGASDGDLVMLAHGILSLSGVHTIEIQFSKIAGTGVVGLRSTRITLWRVP